jgi:predicted hydrocarbon binding protein
MTHAYRQGVIGIGAAALRAMRTALLEDLGEDAGATRLQEMGYAAGEEVFRAFAEWLPTFAAVPHPGDLDADALTEVLSTFLQELGWGTVVTERVGDRAFALSSENWAEADTDAPSDGPSCFFSTGFLASFLTTLAEGSPLAVMEMECRGQGDDRCRFLAGSPETLSAVYDAISEGQDYAVVVGA